MKQAGLVRGPFKATIYCRVHTCALSNYRVPVLTGKGVCLLNKPYSSMLRTTSVCYMISCVYIKVRRH